MRSSPARLAIVALLLAACATTPGLQPAEQEPLADHLTPRQPLPDDLERAAGRLAALALADQPDHAAEVLGWMNDHEEKHIRGGGRPSGLLDNGLDLLNALDGAEHYPERAKEVLQRKDLDPVTRRRLEHAIDSQPLRVASRRLREDRVRKLGSLFNRLVAPATHLLLGDGLHALDTGQAALASLLLMRSFPEATTQERQALRAYQEFLVRHPHAPESEWVSQKVERYQRELHHQLLDQALEVAEQALKQGQPDAALAHVARAERLLPGNSRTQDLRERATAAREQRDHRLLSSLRASVPVEFFLNAEQAAELEQLAVQVLIGPPEAIARHATAWEDRNQALPLREQARFLQTFWQRAPQHEDAFFEAMLEIAAGDPRHNTMARHARWLIRDPEQNPYASYRAARQADRGRRIRWVLFGRFAHGPIRRDLPRPIEWILSLPGLATAMLTMPLRAIQYPWSRQQFGGPVLHAGERYLAHYPDGTHAEPVHRELEELYSVRGSWGRALEHHRGRSSPDPEQVARYREQIAERTLDAAPLHRRLDVRAAIYRSVLNEYGDTQQAQRARRELKELVQSASSQQIRLSRKFLIKNPALWGPGALDLRAELLDGDRQNGELADRGITLLGRTLVEIALLDRDPVVRRVPPERFAHFIAALEDASYRQLLTDERERAAPDPQRDLFFERARLGLLDHTDPRPAARSEATFLTTSEKNLGRESILPVEIVLQGGLEDFGLAAFPRVRLPRETPDAFLYR